MLISNFLSRSKWPGLLLLCACLLLAAPGCKPKDPDPVTTAVHGSVVHKYLEQPLANQKVTVLGLRRIVSNWSSYVEEREVAYAYTDGAGNFSVSYPDSVKSDSFVVVVRPYDRDGRTPVYAGEDNTVALRVYNQPVLALSISIRHNDHPPMSVLPDGHLETPAFTVLDASADLIRYYKSDPQNDYDFLFRYNQDRPAGQRSFLFKTVSTGPYTDTFRASLNIDGGAFGLY